MHKKILVTGANGQLGKTIEELYSNNELELDFIFVGKTELDITNHNEVEIYFNNNKFDYCINWIQCTCCNQHCGNRKERISIVLYYGITH